MATLKDIAERTGLTVSSVSDILNKRQGVKYSAVTREKVEAAASELGYQPNRLARGLISGRTRLIGILVPDIGNPFYNALLKAVSPCLREAGYSLLVEEVPVQETPDTEARALTELAGFRVDGIVAFLVHGIAHEKFFHDQARRGTVLIAMTTPFDDAGIPLDMIGVNFMKGIDEAVTHTVRSGSKRYGFLGNLPWNRKWGKRREYISGALTARGFENEPAHAIPCDHHLEGAYAAFTQFIKKTPAADRPDTLFALNDDLAIGAFRAALDAGLRVPEDLAIIGFDNTPLGRRLPCALSSIGTDIPRLAGDLAGAFLERLAGNNGAPYLRALHDASFHHRQTTRG